ncbi:hypothetical protein ACQ4LE_009475 [Meloidogyne hapla]|uniref:FYVE-type domain-containing protein n=1 Tax=Meloidogyne hapla TaxID=6305 RepID=A0A1I8BMX4_MELHA
MPCTSCMVNYSRSKKEFGCSKCKFSFCRKCLPYDVVIPSISQQPVPVCSNCYSLLNQQHSDLSKDKNREMPSNLTSWSGEDLPPPSLRPLFSKTSKQNGQSKSNKNEWSDLEERLERLNEPIKSTDGLGQEKRIQGINELEERLAALRGVPVDIIRRPGLLVVNQDEGQPNADNERYENEALKLLNEAEQSLQIRKRLPSTSSNLQANNSIQNNNLKTCDSNQDCSSINSSVINETIAQITASKKNENSNSSISSLDIEQQQGLYPNLEECVRKTLEDAAAAESEAAAFLRSHSQQQPTNNDENTKNSTEQQINHQQKQQKNQNLQKFYKFFKKPLFR